MITITVNGLPISAYRTSCHASQELTEEQLQRRIVRSVQRWNHKTIRNHSGAKSSRGRVVFHAERGNA